LKKAEAARRLKDDQDLIWNELEQKLREKEEKLKQCGEDQAKAKGESPWEPFVTAAKEFAKRHSRHSPGHNVAPNVAPQGPASKPPSEEQKNHGLPQLKGQDALNSIIHDAAKDVAGGASEEEIARLSAEAAHELTRSPR